jgi:hypothetical protein
MAKTKSVLWTIKVDKAFDNAVQKTLSLLGYKSKAELAREAIREFLLRRKLFSLLGGEPSLPISLKSSPEDALTEIQKILSDIPTEKIEEEVKAAREEVAKELLGEGQ